MSKFNYIIESQDSVKRVSSAHEAASLMNSLVRKEIFTGNMIKDYFVRNPRAGRINQYRSQFTLSREPRMSESTYGQGCVSPQQDDAYEEQHMVMTSDDEEECRNPAQRLIYTFRAYYNKEQPPTDPGHVVEEEDVEMEEEPPDPVPSRTPPPTPEEKYDRSPERDSQFHRKPLPKPSLKRDFSRVEKECDQEIPAPRRNRNPCIIMTRKKRFELLYGDEDDEMEKNKTM